MIRDLVISGFRGAPRELRFRCGCITLLSGRNGLGKTTFFDALDWCLFGSMWRLGHELGAIENLYVEGKPVVELSLEVDGTPMRIRRTSAGASLDGKPINDRELVEQFIRDPDVFGPYARNLEARVRQLVYLPQADMRELVSPDSTDTLAAIFQALVGVPHAKLLQSGFKRAISRIAERKRDAQGALRELAAQQADLEAKIALIGLEPGSGRERIEEDVRELLGPAGETTTSADILLGRTAVSLADVRGNVARTRESLSALLRDQERRASVDDIQEIRRREMVAVEGNVETAAGEVADSDARVQTALSEANRLEEERLQGVKQREDLENARAALTEIGRLREEARLASGRCRDIEGRELDGRNRLTAKAEERDKHAGLLDALRGDEERLQAEIAVIAERTERLRYKNEAATEVARIEGEVATNLALRERLDREEGATQELVAQLSGVCTESEGFDALDATLTQVANALATGPDNANSCPLCGADYESAAALLEHITRAAEARRSRQSTQQRALQELASLREQQQRRNQKLTALAGKLELLEARRRALLAHIGQIAEDEPRPGELAAALQRADAARAAINAARTQDDRLELEIQELDREVRHRQSEAEVERETAAAAERRIQELLGELSVDARDASEEAVVKVRSSVAAIEERLRVLSETLAGEQKRNRRVRESLERAVTARGRIQGELRAAEEEIRGLENDARGLAASLGVAYDGDVMPVVEAARRRISDGELRERRLENLECDLRNRKAAEDAAGYRMMLEEVLSRKGHLERSVGELTNAAGRLAEIDEAVRARALIEGRDAMERYRSSIQECLDSLYPHGHLNQLAIAEAQTSFSLTDRWLDSGVRPDLFTSTGQLNTLALAVFLGISAMQAVTSLDFVLLDEPVQNLDDVHFLALLTLLKRIALTSQVILSTSDGNIAELVQRQMESSWCRSPEDYSHYHWRGFSATGGPDIEEIAIRKSAVA
jgi:DNA repair exonuclease SbcCD ATPase subunit